MAILILIYNLFQVIINIARRENIARNLGIMSKIGFKRVRVRLRAGKAWESPALAGKRPLYHTG